MIMSGLLLKDWYVLTKQLKLMLLILVIFACILGPSMASFAIIYAAMLPVTAMAYDERSKWNELAIMMPYSPKELVGCKYMLGLISVGVAFTLSLAMQFAASLIRGETFSAESLLLLLFISCLALLLLAINLPVMFKLGVEKGRIAFAILLCGGVVAGMTLSDKLLSLLSKLTSITLPTVGILVITAVIFTVSIPVSVKLKSE